MEPTDRHLLLSIRQTLAARISPQVTDPESSHLLGLTIQTLNELLQREEGGIAARNAAHERLVELIRRGDALITDAGGEKIDAAWPQRPAELIPTQEPEASIDIAWRRLTAQVATLLHLRGTVRDAAQDAAIQTFLADVVHAEVDKKKMVKTAPGPVPTVSAEVAPDAETRFAELAAYFASHLGGGAKFEIREIKQLAGGFSNQTYRLAVGDAGAPSRQIVVRISRSNGIQWPYVATLDEELPIIELAAASGVPVPPQLWMETDTALLGAPFHVMDYVPGDVLGSSMQSYKPVSDDVICNAARVMAKMHSMPWWDWVGKLPPRIVPRRNLTVADSIDLILQRMRTYLEVAWLSPSPVILLLLDWLERNRLTSDAVPVITHGDLGFHNWLFAGDTPVALLDWENVALCSPTKDIANARDALIPAHQWDHFMKCYIDAGGSPPVESEMRYYEVLRQVQALICTSSAMEKMFITIDPLNIAYLELGIMGRDYFFQGVASGLADLIGEHAVKT